MKKNGFNLYDILITMLIIGTIFILTIPALKKDTYQTHIYDKLGKFNSTMQDAIDKWKGENFCPYKLGVCLEYQKKLTGKNPDFEDLKKYLNIAQQINKNNPNDINLLPEKTLDYWGNEKSEYDYRTNNNRDIYIFLDGTIFSVESDEEGFWLLVDLNGKKPPNRIGKDTFHLTLGYKTGNDINFYAKEKTKDGICGHGTKEKITACDPANINPQKENGASPAAFVIINKKLPNYEELSKTIPNFKP